DAGRVEVAELDRVEQLHFVPELLAQAVGGREERVWGDHQPLGRPVPLQPGEGRELVDRDVGVVDEDVAAFDGDLDTPDQDDAVVAGEGGQLVVIGHEVVVADAEDLVAFTGGTRDHLAGVVRDEGLRLPRVDVQVGLEPRVHHAAFRSNADTNYPSPRKSAVYLNSGLGPIRL